MSLVRRILLNSSIDLVEWPTVQMAVAEPFSEGWAFVEDFIRSPLRVFALASVLTFYVSCLLADL
jgi:hypothetical protein